MIQKNKSKSSKMRIADLILIIASIVLIFFTFIGSLLMCKGDWLTASLLTLGVGVIAAILIAFMIFAKKQTDNVECMRILECVALALFLGLAYFVAIEPFNHAVIAMNSSKELSVAIENDIKSLEESKNQFFANERENISTASASIAKVSGTLHIDEEYKDVVERTMALKHKNFYGSQAELKRLSTKYTEMFEEKLMDESFADYDLTKIVNDAQDMKRDVDAGFFFTFPSVAIDMDSLSGKMRKLQDEKSKELGIRKLEIKDGKYIAPILSTTYQAAYQNSAFSNMLYGYNEISKPGFAIGFFTMILLLAVYWAEPRTKRIRPNKKTNYGIKL